MRPWTQWRVLQQQLCQKECALPDHQANAAEAVSCMAAHAGWRGQAFLVPSDVQLRGPVAMLVRAAALRAHAHVAVPC